MPIHDWTRVDPGVFHDFHCTWVVDIKRQLHGGILPHGYYAMVEQSASGPIIPDVLALERKSHATNGDVSVSSEIRENGMILLAEVPPKVSIHSRSDVEQYLTKARQIVIRHSRNDRLVAIIEIVSPGNKHSNFAIQAFVDKAVGCLRVGVHLLVVDLLPPNARAPQGLHGLIWPELADEEFRLPADKPLVFASYQAGDIKEAFVQPAAVDDGLPVMPLFLEPGAYVNLPLEPTYQNAVQALPRHWREVLEAE